MSRWLWALRLSYEPGSPARIFPAPETIFSPFFPGVHTPAIGGISASPPVFFTTSAIPRRRLIASYAICSYLPFA